ncbi:MAG: VOC family protein [Planctomycetota bacterium]
MTRHHRIDYIEIPVTDMAASKAFYAGAFGWAFADYGPGYAGIQDPDPERDGEIGGLYEGPPVVPGGALVILYSDDLAASEAAVRSAGGEISKPIFEFPGGRRFQFRDPNGHELGVWSDR